MNKSIVPKTSNANFLVQIKRRSDFTLDFLQLKLLEYWKNVQI